MPHADIGMSPILPTDGGEFKTDDGTVNPTLCKFTCPKCNSPMILRDGS